MACLSAANGDGLRLLGDMPPWPHSSWRCAVCVGQTYYRQLHAADKKLLGSDERVACLATGAFRITSDGCIQLTNNCLAVTKVLHARHPSLRLACGVQAQRDFFGSHTYERTDKEGSFHTVWDPNFGSKDSITTSGYNN